MRKVLWSECFYHLQNSYVEILMPNVIELRRWASGRRLGHENGVLRDELNALIKESQRAGLSLSPCEDAVRRHQPS